MSEKAKKYFDVLLEYKDNIIPKHVMDELDIDLNEIDLDTIEEEGKVEIDLEKLSAPELEMADDDIEISEKQIDQLVEKVSKEIIDSCIGAIRRDKLGQLVD